MSRIMPLLGVCLVPFRALAVETLRILMDEKGGAVEVVGKSLSLGRDEEEASFVAVDSGRAIVKSVDGQLEMNGALWPHEAARFRVSADGSDGGIRIGASRVRGDLVVRLRRNRLQLINVLPLEDYLVGVVGSEMPPGFPDEALKAQAVAARTYALKKKLDSVDLPFHLGSSVLHQVYRGLSHRDERVRAAVEATVGQVLTFDLEPIEAYFHGSCGGHTESGLAALARDLPYLQPVECPCAKLPASRWELSIPVGELERLFGVSDADAFAIATRSSTGRARTVTLGTNRLVDAVEFRQKLGYDRLKSLWFELERPSAPGQVRLTGRGYGHGAGMCQWGAKVYAEQHWTYREILLHYYPGVEIQRLY